MDEKILIALRNLSKATKFFEMVDKCCQLSRIHETKKEVDEYARTC